MAMVLTQEAVVNAPKRPRGRPSHDSTVLGQINSEAYEVTYLSAQARLKARRAKRFDLLGDRARADLRAVLNEALYAVRGRDLDDAEAGIIDAIDMLTEIDDLDRQEDGEGSAHLATMDGIENDAALINDAGRRIIARTEPRNMRVVGGLQ